MKLVQIAALLAIAGVATANNGTATGPGGLIPGAGTGGGSTYPTLPPTPGESVVTLPADVTSVTSIEVQGLAHTWIGDMQMVLVDPTGEGHLIFLRPGYLNTGTFGNSGDFLGGDYEFIESGAPNNLPTTSTTATNPPAGTYNQTFHSGGIMWVSGDGNVFNTALGSVTGIAGDWTLRFYDWAGGDAGSFTGWTLNYRGDSGPGTPICFGDGSGAACGCGNESGVGSGEGCHNSLGVGGILGASGTASVTAADLTLEVSGVRAQPGLFFQGTATLMGGDGVSFGDGIRCCGGTVVRVNLENPMGTEPVTTATTITTDSQNYPTTAGTPTITSGILPSDKRCYQYWYRDPGSPCGSNFNFSNAVSVIWGP